MLKRAGKLEATVVKEINKAKKTALKDPAVNGASALETALAEVFSWNDRLAKTEEKLAGGWTRKCGSLASPATIFPGACAIRTCVVEDCAIAAARCQACFGDQRVRRLEPGLRTADDRSANGSCP